MPVRDAGSAEPRPGLFALLRSVPDLVTRLIRDEIRSAQEEFSRKVKATGLGAGLAAAGAVLALFALGALVTAGIAGLDLVLPHWLSALIVAGGLLLIAGILVAVGVAKLKAGVPPVPTDAVESMKQDVRAVAGAGRG